MILLKAILCPFFTLYVLWVFYLAVMNLKRARDAAVITNHGLAWSLMP